MERSIKLERPLTDKVKSTFYVDIGTLQIRISDTT
jgi:hypothetical protein